MNRADEIIEEARLNTPSYRTDNKKDVLSESAFITDKKGAPLQAFPPQIQTIIKAWSTAYQLPVEFFIGGVLAAVSGAIGTGYKLRLKTGWEVHANIYLAVVGSSGIGKTPALNACLRPLQDKDNELAKEFQLALLALSEAQENDLPTGEYPIQKQLLINNTTIEAVFKILSENPRGIMCYQDELAGWVKSMNQYKSGSDVEYWLSFHNNDWKKISRISSDSYSVPNPYVSVIGGIQPGVLKELVKNGNKDNGFLYRLLFAYPESCKKEYLNDNEIEGSIQDQYSTIIESIINGSNSALGLDNAVLRLSAKAYEHYRSYNIEMVDKINDTTIDGLKSLLAKIENHSLRFALILEALYAACENRDLYFEESYVSERSMLGAIQLARYFEYTATRVFSRLFEDDPLLDFDENQLSFYNKLPTIFSTGQAVEIALSNGLYKARATKQFLSNKELFKKTKRGWYQKII